MAAPRALDADRPSRRQSWTTMRMSRHLCQVMSGASAAPWRQAALPPPPRTRPGREPSASEIRRLVDAARSQPGAVGHAEPEIGAAPRARDPRRATTAPCAASSSLLTTRRASCGSRPPTASTGRAPRSATESARASRAGSSRAAGRSSCRASAASRCSCTARPKRPELPQQELSFVCVPIILNRKADRRARRRPEVQARPRLRPHVKFLGVVASMIAQAIKIQRLVEEERRRLVDENTHLRQELRERYDFSNIIGTSGPMRQIYEQVAQVARHQHHRADPRRVGHGQGADRARASTTTRCAPRSRSSR